MRGGVSCTITPILFSLIPSHSQLTNYLLRILSKAKTVNTIARNAIAEPTLIPHIATLNTLSITHDSTNTILIRRSPITLSNLFIIINNFVKHWSIAILFFVITSKFFLLIFHHFKVEFFVIISHNNKELKVNNKINKFITLIKRTLISIHIGSAEFGPLSVRFGCLRMRCTHKHNSRSICFVNQ